MCGEHAPFSTIFFQRQGSSPHVRGTHLRGELHVQAGGIIPACAGNTLIGTSYFVTIWDHPRMCGEHSVIDCYDIWIPGSSPHVRGTQMFGIPVKSKLRIIPACAGNTCSPPSTRCRSRDHPRMCGEHSPAATAARCRSGSSPHVRGTPDKDDATVHCRGIIPACAGNTRNTVILAVVRGDHPRMCGEHLRLTSKSLRAGGSSPHVRGTHRPARRAMGSRGIIPACAGNTAHPRWASAPAWDHPRMCGEHRAPGLGKDNKRGSSPHVRGTQIFSGA